MLSSYLLASCLGAAPAPLGVYPQLGYLSPLAPASTTLQAGTPCIPRPSQAHPASMATPGAEKPGQLRLSSMPQPSQADLSHGDLHEEQRAASTDSWGDVHNEQPSVKTEVEAEDEQQPSQSPKVSLHSDPRVETQSSCLKPCSSAVKFSIDSILGLGTAATASSHVTGLGGRTGSDSQTALNKQPESGCRLAAGSGSQNESLESAGTMVASATSSSYHSADQHSLFLPAAADSAQCLVCEDKDDDKADETDNTKSDDQASYPWLQCTRYHPPKLQRNKKKDGGGKKRKLGRNPRVPFTQQQVAVLEEKFRRTHYLSSMDVAELSTALTLSETRVKIWFQNRRARERREREASQRAQLLTQKPYQPLSIPSVTWALTSQLAPSPFSPRYRNDMNFRAGLFSSAFSAFSTLVRHDVNADTQSSLPCPWTETHNSDDDNVF